MRKETHQVMLSLASNIEQERHILAAREALKDVISELRFTSAHWTEPFSTTSQQMYLNQLAIGVTDLPVNKFNSYLKEIEQALGRERDRKEIVTIDIDLLSYDNTKYHLKDWERPYIKDLLKEI